MARICTAFARSKNHRRTACISSPVYGLIRKSSQSTFRTDKSGDNPAWIPLSMYDVNCSTRNCGRSPSVGVGETEMKGINGIETAPSHRPRSNAVNRPCVCMCVHVCVCACQSTTKENREKMTRQGPHHGFVCIDDQVNTAATSIFFRFHLLNRREVYREKYRVGRHLVGDIIAQPCATGLSDREPTAMHLTLDGWNLQSSAIRHCCDPSDIANSGSRSGEAEYGTGTTPRPWY
jgi:hypothetical protein